MRLKEILDDMDSNIIKFDYESDENTYERCIHTSNNWILHKEEFFIYIRI